MKKKYLLFIVLLLSSKLFAQYTPRAPRPLPPPLPFREVSGIVKDSVDNPLIGAMVTLTSKTDTLRTTANNDGIFIFRNVKSATFALSISEVGFVPSTRKYLNNDAVKKIILDPIVLKIQSNMLTEVTIKGPSITYKTDTVEYRASDYKVRENATVDELLKKMEGMEVGSDGSVTHQGQQVKKARLNGKDYAGGGVAQAIQNLPADIVEKIQIIDDYGDEAARTGVKDGDPQKVLNITTKPDRSVGNIARLTAGEGSNSRYDDRVFLQRINANEQIGLIGNIRNTVNGVPSAGISSGGFGSQSSSGGSGGTTKSGGPSFNYRDQWSKKIQVNGSYTYSYNDVNSLNSSSGQQYTVFDSIKRTTYFNNESTGNNNSKSHNFNFELEYSIDSANFLRVSPTYSYTGSDNDNNSTSLDSGFIHQGSSGISNSNSVNRSYGATVFYQHLFKKRRRNISFQLSYTHSNSEQTSEQNRHILYYNDAVSTTTPFLDSLVHRTINRGSLTKNYRASLTYVEPLNLLSQLEFNAQLIYRGYNNIATTNNIIDSLDNLQVPIDSLNNIYHYSFTEGRIALNYRLNKTKYNLSLGVTAIPTLLQGQREGYQGSVRSTDFNLIPIIRYEYAWSRQERMSINYSGTPTEPTFNQIQPYTDLTNQQNPVVGNPDLKPSFTNSINLQYNNYIANSQLNLSANINTSFVNDQVTTNNVYVRTPITHRNKVTGELKTDSTFITYTHYINLSGSYSINGNYNIAKQFDDRKYNLELNGNISNGHNVSMENNVIVLSNTWRFNERFGPRINPNENIEVNPYLSYDVTKSNSTISTYNTDTKTIALHIDGKMYFLKTWLIGYSASKNFVTGISQNITKNPFVANLSFEKEFFKKRNGTLRVEAFDLFDQNNFVNRVFSQNGSYTDTKTNALSRYVMVSFRLNLQKWSGVPKRNSRVMQRRGDGSFIY